MKASSNVRHYQNHSDYLKRAQSRGEALKSAKSSQPQTQPQKDIQKKNEGTSPDKVEISSPKTDSASPSVGTIVSEIPGVAAKVIAEVAQNIEITDTPELAPKDAGPGVFFVSGFRLFGLSSSNSDGIFEMAKHSEEAQHYSWSDEDELLDKIIQEHQEGPLVLVGHSLGANAAVRIANKLNTAEHGFRSVDLLVTMDAFGLNNDIIPSNVQKNMNFIGHRNVFLNDGPNIARNMKTTDVMNELRDELHTKIDNAPDIQSRIYQNIEGVISRAKEQLDNASSPWRFQNQGHQDSLLDKAPARET